jgi:putative solute:sodium symporter small subunit
MADDDERGEDGRTVPVVDHSRGAYWRANLRVVRRCLIVWFTVSFGFGILLRDPLDAISLGGFGLGFWFAQQGAIWVFLGLIAYYVWAMNRIDHEYDVDDDPGHEPPADGGA